jgi:hypothetical protein
MFAYVIFAAALAGLFKLFSPGGVMTTPKRALTGKTFLTFTKTYDAKYPTHAADVHLACARFGSAYDATFVYPDTPLKALDRVRALYSIREDALIACNEIKLRLPNDLAEERDFVRSYEDLDRRMNEYIEDAKSRLGVFVHPGPMSSAYAAKKYRAANDVFS